MLHRQQLVRYVKQPITIGRRLLAFDWHKARCLKVLSTVGKPVSCSPAKVIFKVISLGARDCNHWNRQQKKS